MSKREWVAFGVPAAAVVVCSTLLWEVSGSDATAAQDYVFARIDDVDCAHPDAAPPMTLLPMGTPDPIVRSALNEAWEITQKQNTSAEIASIACQRVTEMFAEPRPQDRIDVHLGLRRDSQDRLRFARAITSIIVDRPSPQEDLEIEGGFIILGEVRVD